MEEAEKKIDDFMENEKGGYRSRVELISEAIRLRLGIAKLGKKKR